MALPNSIPRGHSEAPLVRVEVRQGSSRPVWHDVAGEELLIGSVPGCDLRITGANLPPMIAQVVRRPDGVRIRKLAAAQPILLNGQPVSTQATLAHGDVLHIGTVELHIHMALAAQTAVVPRAEPPPSPAVTFVPFPSVPESHSHEPPQRHRGDSDSHGLDVARRQLEEQAQELEADRVLWYRRREEIEREWHDHQQRLAQVRNQIRDQEQQLAAKRAEVQHVERELARLLADRDEREQHLEREHKEIEKLRAELARVQKEASGRVQVDRSDIANRERAILERERQVAAREQDLKEREARAALSPSRPTSPYQSELIPIDRIERPSSTLTLKYQQLQRDAGEIEEHARQLDTNAERLRVEAEQLNAQRQVQAATATELSERAAQLESQQALVAALRTRLEHLRDELRQQSQQLSAERSRQEAVAAQLQERMAAAAKLQADLQADSINRERERAEFEERSAALQAAIAQMHQLRQNLEEDDRRLHERAAQIEQQAAEQTEQVGLMRARAQQLLELQQRTEADRQSIKEREAALTQAEEIRKALAEQLRRRGEDLVARGKALEEQSQVLVVRGQDIDALREQLQRERQLESEQTAKLRQELDAKAAETDRLNAALAQREENLRRQVERLKEAGELVATDRQAILVDKVQWEAEQQQVLEQIAQSRQELESFRDQILHQAAELLRQAPDAELRSAGAIEHLAQAREQLKEHLGELHSYARQSQEDLQELRAQVQSESERLRHQELALQRARSEHRLAITAFRQQLIDWQGRVGSLRHLFAQNESRLELKHQALANAAREVDAGVKELARQSETLHEREREVDERKQEVASHLADMQEWYRAKLRELAGARPGKEYRGEVLEMPVANRVNDMEHADETAAAPADEKSILSLTGDVDPADRQLGELLLSLGLVDPDVLKPLWTEARRQRRTLRQILLSSGAITLYQLALIEAGNLDALMLGPYRVIDRIQTTPRETLYRVYDPGRSTLALLRHLSEAEMLDAVHPDEYRQRFGAAAVLVHPNLAATYEILEILDRPAVLQEWVRGLPSTDWPALAAVPGVWHRLLSQAALALKTLHQAGLAHGRLEAQHFVLTADGSVKLTGIGEPAWLGGQPESSEPHLNDLAALGRIAGDWSMLVTRRKSSKPRPLPEPLQLVLRRLGTAAFSGDFDGDDPVMIPPLPEEDRYPSVAALLEDLEHAGATLAANHEAWDRLVKHVGDHVIEGAALRRTA